jgi:N-methylhydantoinase A
MMAASDLTAEAVAAAVAELRASLADGMDADTETISYELRYEGQSFELPVDAGPEPPRDELVRGFAEAHERRYGFDVPDAPVELVAIRLALEGTAPAPAPRAAERDVEESSRRVHFGDEWRQTQVSRGEPPEGSTFEGPAVLEMPESTLVLPPGWRAEVDRHGTVIAEAEEA